MQVDFYILDSAPMEDALLFTCRLIEKAYLRSHRIFVYCENIDQAHAVDELLWTYKPEGFIPHHLQGEGPKPPPPVQIGYQHAPHDFHDILINLSSQLPDFFTQFRRVLEVVRAEDAAKDVSRQHYRVYKAHGAILKTHTC